MNKEKLNPKHKDAMEYPGELYVETDRMDDACFLARKEYWQLKDVIESKERAGNRC